MMIEKAINELREGEMVLIHDSSSREDEVDLVMATEFTKAEDVARMRLDGGGLICLAVDRDIWEMLGLPFMADILASSQKRSPLLNYLKADDIPYDEKSSFSVTINHRKTFTGITDKDRALTIREMGEFCKDLPKQRIKEEFGKQFRSPGHVPLLLSSGLDKRAGHTELSTALLKMAPLTPVAMICEMLDAETKKSLSREKAQEYARKNQLVFLEGSEIKLSWEKWSK